MPPLLRKLWDEDFESPLTDFIVLLQEHLAQVPERDWEAVSIKFEDGKLSLLLYPESEPRGNVALEWEAYWKYNKAQS